jgi:single-strand DNA-binding protein
MNKLCIIGNLTKDPEIKQVQTKDGPVSCCDFTVAVNGRRKQESEAVFFRCSAWRGIAEIVGKYGSKGKKVCVVGPVSARGYKDKDGNPCVSLNVQVEDFEFLTPRGDADETGLRKDGFTEVTDEDVPF